MGLYVDDSIIAGNRKLEVFSRRAEQEFEHQPRNSGPFVFSEIELDWEDSVIITSKKKYILKLNNPEPDATFDVFRSLGHQLGWIINCSPDVMAG